MCIGLFVFVILFFNAGFLSANTINSSASSRKNPFLFSDEEELLERRTEPASLAKPVEQKPKVQKKIVQKEYYESSAHVVSAILFAPPHSRAIMDGHIVSEGDTFANKNVLKINAESVIVEEAGYKYIVRLPKVGQ